MGLFSRRKPVEVPAGKMTEIAVVGTSRRQRAVPAVGAGVFTLRRDPGNKHDKNAVEVLAGKKMIGYLPADDARRYSAALAAIKSSIQVPGEVRQGATGRWVLLQVPSAAAVRKLKG